MTRPARIWTLRAMNRVYIENLGCSKNQVDAETMLQYLADTGEWEYTEDPAEAEVILVNTCGFIESAREESIQTLLSLRESCPQAKIMMTGCLAERYAETMADELWEADGFFGNRDLSRIVDAARQMLEHRRTVEIPRDYRFDTAQRETSFSFPGSTYVKLSEGCSHRCRYCAIPLIRGDLRSRESGEVLDEIKFAVARGAREINLIAQDLAAFGTDRGSSQFLDLLKYACDIPGDFFIRMLYIHPDAFPGELPALVESRKKLLGYFDIPFQHASRKVLQGMGRSGSGEGYLELIEQIRSEVTDAVIRSTFMTGFPGEGPEEFDQLCSFMTRAKMDWAGMFVYSREEGTPAYGDRSAAEHRRAVKEADRRMLQLQQLQGPITEERLDRWINREVEVLIEEIIPEEDLSIGRSFMQAPEVDGAIVVLTGDVPPGSSVRCRIERRNGVDLEAEPVRGETDA